MNRTILGDNPPNVCGCEECQQLPAQERAPGTHPEGCSCFHCWTGEDAAEARAPMMAGERILEIFSEARERMGPWPEVEEEEVCACWDNLQILRAKAWHDFEEVGGTEEAYLQTFIPWAIDNADAPIFVNHLQAYMAGRFAGIVEALEHVPTREPTNESNL